MSGSLAIQRSGSSLSSLPRNGSHTSLAGSLSRGGSSHCLATLAASADTQQQDAVASPGRACNRGATVVVSASSLQAAALPASAASLQEYIATGPLVHLCGAAVDISKWISNGQRLAQQLGFDHDDLDDVQRLRIYHYYLPIYFWCQSQLNSHKASGSKSALVLGISAPQGCGKTTIVEQLEQLFNWSGQRAASISIDDFYLTYKDQSELASSNPSNKLLKYRGNAGSHDLALGAETLRSLRDLVEVGQSMQVPRYDKSAYSGLGDRAPGSQWPSIDAPVDIILFEGWMLGFSALPDDQVVSVDSDLVKVNNFLRTYHQTWDSLVDSWLVIRIGNPQWVFKWRLQAEERMRSSGKPGMTDEQIADFVSRFMPAYQAYLPQLYASGPTTCKKGHTLVIEVDQNRSPVARQPAPVA